MLSAIVTLKSAMVLNSINGARTPSVKDDGWSCPSNLPVGWSNARTGGSVTVGANLGFLDCERTKATIGVRQFNIQVVMPNQ